MFDVSYIDDKMYSLTLFLITLVIQGWSLSVKVFILFGIKSLKMFKRVLLNNVFTIKSIFPVERFYCWVYCFNVGVAIIPYQMLISRRVKYLHINLCKYYLVVAVLVEWRMHSTICYHVWLISKSQIYARRWWWKNVGSLIIWWSL